MGRPLINHSHDPFLGYTINGLRMVRMINLLGLSIIPPVRRKKKLMSKVRKVLKI